MVFLKQEYNNKRKKLKRYSRKNLYTKVYPTYIRHTIPDLLLTNQGYTKEQLIRDIYRLIDCNTSISRINKTVEKDGIEEKKTKIFESNYCNIFTLCSTCAEKISARRRMKYEKAIKRMAETYKENVYMLTFTTKDKETFNASYDSLREGLRKYLLMGQLRGVTPRGEQIRSGGEAAKIKAMAVSIEIQKGKNLKGWHVHAHALVFCDSRINYTIYDKKIRTEITQEIRKEKGRAPKKEELFPAVKKWSFLNGKKIAVSSATSQWLQCTKDSANLRFDKMEGSPKEIFEQCNEIMKYTSKIGSFSRDDILEILLNRKGKRFFSTYGELYNQSETPEPEEEKVLFQEMDGFVWSNKNEEYLPVLNEQNKISVERYNKRELIYKAQGYIVQAYHEKQRVIKSIVRGVMERSDILAEEIANSSPDKSKDLEGQYHIFKKAAIMNIDQVSSAYNVTKKKIFKKVLGIRLRVKDRIVNPTPVQKLYLERVKPILQLC